MKIIKYPHSCIMIEVCNKKVLFDPGYINYEERFKNEWDKADYIFVTHGHQDHCYVNVIKDLKGKVYSTLEVSNRYKELNIKIVKSGDMIEFENFKVEVVNAVHGYLPQMKGDSIKENVGYILEDGNKRIYVSSDTMCFENDYKAQILFLAVSGHVCMTEYEAALTAKDMEGELVIPVHMESPKHPVNIEKVKKTFEEFGVKYKIMENGEEIEI